MPGSAVHVRHAASRFFRIATWTFLINAPCRRSKGAGRSIASRTPVGRRTDGKSRRFRVTILARYLRAPGCSSCSTTVTATASRRLDHWREIIDDPTLAGTLLDRLAHDAYRITLSSADNCSQPCGARGASVNRRSRFLLICRGSHGVAGSIRLGDLGQPRVPGPMLQKIRHYLWRGRGYINVTQ